jgi:electron transfer flavoprotein beta subunit
VKLVVCVKEVAKLDEEFELADDGLSVEPDCLEWDLNEWDSFALEAALRLRESLDGSDHEVVAVTVGGEEAEEGLLGCLARGADRAVRVWAQDPSPALAAGDVLVVARLLAAAVKREQPDLVLCGVQSSDAVNGSTGTALAGLLELPRVAVVKEISYEPQTNSAVVARELEGGLVERLRIALPALLTVQTGINEPRYATLRAIKQAREKPLERLTGDDLGVDEDELAAAAGARLLALVAPERGAGAQMIDGSPAQIAQRILELVRERVGG